jgi:hypothetical protein
MISQLADGRHQLGESAAFRLPEQFRATTTLDVMKLHVRPGSHAPATVPP